MTKTFLPLVAFAMLAIASLATSSAQAAIICDEDGCSRAVVVRGPVLIVVDED